MTFRAPHRRVAGVLLPLFSMRSSTSWGIGEFLDLIPFSQWMDEAGLSLLQLLPLNEMAPGQNSPYSAMASAALDPLFISPDAMGEFAHAGGVEALPKEAREALETARRATQIDFDAVRAAKRAAFEMAFDRAPRAGGDRALDQFIAREAAWLGEYTLYRALADAHGPDWTQWPGALRNRDAGALSVARREQAPRMRFYAWLQFHASSQWAAARAQAREQGVEVFGDLPFMVNAASADVWERQHDFMLDASVGTPPDPFSATGQDWGVPVYRWPEIAQGGYEWLRRRGERASALYDGFRVDHLVGFYRTFVRPHDGGEPYFLPAHEHEQIAQGEHLLRMFGDTGASITAEDLGTVPDYVRESLGRLGIPGYLIMRWERYWHDEPAKPFKDPAQWVENGVATSGTHDTEPLSVWWEQAGDEERRQVARIPSVNRTIGDNPPAAFTPQVRDALLGALYDSRTNLLITPLQDLFGWSDRINTPATVGDGNWRWALPWPVDRLASIPVAAARAGELKDLAQRTGRL